MKKLQFIKELMVYKKVKKYLNKPKNDDHDHEIKLDVSSNIDGQSVEEKNKKVNKTKGIFEGIKENKIFKKNEKRK